MQTGPIQAIAIAFDRVDQFKGQILRELDELRAHGLIRIIDLRFVMKEADGTIRALQEQDLPDGSGSSVGTLVDPLLGLGVTVESQPEPAELETMLIPEQGPGLTLNEIRLAATDLAPGTAAAVVLLEHAWAIGLATAIREAGGRMVAQGFLTRDALLAVGRELNAIVEAEVAVERAAALRGAALLDTLSTLEAAAELEQAAIAQAAATVEAVDTFRMAIAAEAVRALVVAGLLTDADAPAAIDALVDADLITTEAFQQATAAADAAIAELSQEW
ncbi:MAG: hypothetical protein N2378_17620 [Chloroflexaceae bacterium]|nr:hypothetical protein [Chloroflexaceae bacterium]